MPRISALALVVYASALQPPLTARLRANALRAEPGGPPPGVASGGPPRGPPPGTPGGPPRGPPGGPPKQRDETNAVVDAAVDALFSLLYVGDDSGAADSSKNLRVLWARAVLSGRGIIDDPQAADIAILAATGVAFAGLVGWARHRVSTQEKESPPT